MSGMLPPPPDPSKATLQKYGLSLEDWRALLDRQGGVCVICEKPSQRLCIDHDHVPGFKHMAPADQRRYVRGLLCWFCNSHIVGRGVTTAKLRNALRYLEAPRPFEDELARRRAL